MILIAHRGNTEGPRPEKENHPDYIDKAINLGYDVEVDIWGSFATKLFLGHDEPQFQVTPDWIFKRGKKLWLHAKNIQAFHSFAHQTTGLQAFWHQTDRYTLTTNGYIWTYPGKDLTENSIVVMPEKYLEKWWRYKFTECLGICSDHIIKYRG